MNKKILWSSLLIILGILLLLRNLNIIFFTIGSLFSLWPFLIVVIGISLLPIKDWIKSVVNVTILIVAVLVLINNTDSFFTPKPHHKHFHNWNDTNIDFHVDTDLDTAYTPVYINPFDNSQGGLSLCERYENSKFVNYDMNLEAGKFVIGQGNDENLTCFQTYSDKDNYYSLSSIGNDNSINLSLEYNNNKKIRSSVNNTENYEIALNTKPVWDININAGVSNIKFDGSPLKIRSLDVSGGVSAIEIIIGKLEKNVDLNISAGVSKVIIRIPSDAYCTLSSESALNRKNLNNFMKQKQGYYIHQPAVETASCNINIKLTAALSDLEIVQY